MKLTLTLAIAVALAGCASTSYRDQLVAYDRALSSERANEDRARERMAEMQVQCATLADAGAISACMLGVTATTLAQHGAGRNSTPPPPAPPPSAGQQIGSFLLGIARVAVPAYVQIRQSDNATEAAIAQSEALYGMLSDQSQAFAGLGAAALGSMERTAQTGFGALGDTSQSAVDAMARANESWADAAARMAPTINVTGDGNTVGDGNEVAVDQSATGRDRIGEGDGTEIVIETIGGDRIDQSGSGNRIGSPGPYEVVCNPAAGPGAPGAPGGTVGNDGNAPGAPGGPGGSTGPVDCEAGGG